MRVECEVSTVQLEGDYVEVEGVTAECPRCSHQTESFGTSDASIKRCLVLMREECPRDENNYYVASGESYL